jgi:hypothetical protein
MSRSIERRKVDERLAPERGRSVYTVDVDGEAVLLDEGTGRLHLLNVTAALVWACFDGRSTIGEIVTDVSDELGTPRDQVLADTLAVTRQLASEGLLANVRPARPRGKPIDANAHADPPFLPEPPNL